MPEPCTSEGRINSLESKDQHLQDQLTRIENKLDIIVSQVNKIAVLEANHGYHKDAIERAFTRIAEIEKANAAFVKTAEEFINQTKGMARMAWVLWGVLGSGLGLVALKVILMGHT